MSISPFVHEAWIPPERQNAVDWVPANVRIPSETETPGPFDLDLFPHFRGVLEAVDDPMTRRIYLQWAARNGKTFGGLSILLFFGATQPRPSMLGTPTEDMADDLIETKLYPMLEECHATADRIPRPEHRNKRFVSLGRCRIRKAYSGAPKTMAGFPACYALATEISGWSNRKSAEADPINLFGQRARLYPFHSKYVYESTPGLKGECRITRLMTKGTTQRRLRYVPCPKCGTYQPLVFGDADPKSAGLKWKKARGGRSDVQLAEETAHYRCVNGCRIENADRPAMMRAGLWVPEGQEVDADGRLTGDPHVASVTNVGFGPLSSLYSLAISGWGQLVAEWLDSKAQGAEGIREFVNGILGEAWDPDPDRTEPSELAERLAIDAPLRVVPEWGCFLTCGVDVGWIGEELIFHWWVAAWGRHGRGQLIDYGVTGGQDEFCTLLETISYPCADGRPNLKPDRVGVDSGDGHVTNQIYELCRSRPGWWPIKGSTGSSFPDVYQLGHQRAGKSAKLLAALKKRGSGDLMIANSQRSQEWIEHLVTGLTSRNKPDWFGLPVEATEDEDLLDQLLAEHPEQRPDPSGHIRNVWIRTGDNEFRDAARYAWVLAWHVTRGGRRWGRLSHPGEEVVRKTIDDRGSRMKAPRIAPIGQPPILDPTRTTHRRRPKP